MKQINGTSLPCKECVLTIGKFEGIHLGHRALIGATVSRARELGLPSVVLAFEPHPNIVLSKPETGYKPVFNVKERTYLLGQIPGIDFALTYPFTKELAKIAPAEFCRIIFNDLGGKEIFIGENFGFGSERGGNAEFLKESAAAYNAKVHVAKLMYDSQNNLDNNLNNKTEQIQISTSGIRGLIERGNLAEAAMQLGHPFFIMSETVTGRRLGRTLGFPTLNIIPEGDKLTPPNGVYSTNFVYGGIRYPSVTNTGTNPTVNNTRLRTVETYVLEPPDVLLYDDFYGQEMMLEFIDFIRPELKFESKDALVQQINIDIHKLGLQNLNGTVKIDKQEPEMFGTLLF